MKKKLILNLAVIIFAAFGFGTLNGSSSTTFAMESSNDNISVSDEQTAKKHKRDRTEKNIKSEDELPENVANAIIARDKLKDELAEFLNSTHIFDQAYLNSLKNLRASALKTRINEHEKHTEINKDHADTARKLIIKIRKAERTVDYFYNPKLNK